MNITLYGLLHLAEHESSAINANVKCFSEQVLLYLKNAINLSLSLNKRGIDYTLLTNRKDDLDEELKSLDPCGHLKVVNMAFNLKVPSGVKFFSAHFKLDVFSYFASLEDGHYVGLIDLDMIALADVPECLKYIVNNKIPVCYDISDQVIPAYGHDVIVKDMRKISPTIGEGRWIGGELIMGTPAFFRSLDTEVKSIYECYIDSVDNLHHQGDEMLTSVALERLRHKGTYIADSGTLGIVGRYWSVPVLHPQKPFKYFKNCFLLHLPSDKHFLARLDYKDTQSSANFLRTYCSYLRITKFKLFIFQLLSLFRKHIFAL